MSEDYLWDRSGAPDSEVEKLEQLLSPYRSESRLAYPQLPAQLPQRNAALRWMPVAAAAAIAVLAVAGIWTLAQKPEMSQWMLGSNAVAVGQTIKTYKFPAKLEASSIGTLELAPGSELRVLRSGSRKQLVELQRGSMRAFIWAPPAKFAAETKSAKAIDLGCAYQLAVEPDGSGLLTVDLGWVAFQKGAIESFIPAGAACHTSMKAGPGLPYFETASGALRASVERFEESGGTAGIPSILMHASRKDALTVWHLLARTSGAERAATARRLKELVPDVDETSLNSPEGVDAAWNRLGLGETSWWREWKREWPRGK